MTNPITRPRCQVLFHQGLVHHWRPNILPELQAIETLDASLNVLGVQATKTMDSLAGTFEIDLTYDRRALAAQTGIPIAQLPSWSRILLPGNRVTIAFSRGELLPMDHPAPHIFVPGTDPLIPWMVGFIDTVTDITSWPQGQVRHTIKIRGRDYGRILQVHELHWMIATSWTLSDIEAQERIRRGLKKQGTPVEMVEYVMDVLVGDLEYPDAKQYIIYKDGQLDQEGPPTPGPFQPIDVDPVTNLKVLDPRLKDPGEHGWCLPQEMWDRGKFANFLSRFNDRPFTELWTDTRPDGFFSLYMRETPFRRELWEKLPTKIVPSADVLYRDFTRNEVERLNCLMIDTTYDVGTSNRDALFLAANLLRWDRFSYENGSEHHGVRKWVAQSMYNCPMPPDVARGAQAIRDYNVNDALHNDEQLKQLYEGTGEVFDLLRKRLDKLWKMLSQSHRLYDGRVIVRGDPFWRVGYVYQDESIPNASADPHDQPRVWGYVQTVTMEWRFGGPFRTHLGLQRCTRLTMLAGESLPTDGTEWRTRWSEARQQQAFDAVTL